MRTIARSPVRIPAGKPLVHSRQWSPLPQLQIPCVEIVEGEGVKRKQITALARKIKNSDGIAIVYVRKNLERIRVSRDQAWDLLFPAVTAYIKKIFRKFQIDDESASECVARTWFNIVKHFDSYDPGSIENEAHFLCWVQFIARNQAFNFFKEQKRTKQCIKMLEKLT